MTTVDSTDAVTVALRPPCHTQFPSAGQQSKQWPPLQRWPPSVTIAVVYGCPVRMSARSGQRTPRKFTVNTIIALEFTRSCALHD